ncbi:MAG TPA: 23S rRNA (guanosine(2251)-2'-O)-methyltransferase RlmB [Candidatus Limnocylindrales bacterium]|nr:23S rRNA (guanosine(2251)-2'-O)-methyltransferase RlmB [Candidatus Limnocylindrales bacterium]
MPRRERNRSGARRGPSHSGDDGSRIAVAGPNAVEAALSARGASSVARVFRVFLEEPAPRRAHALAHQARESGIPVSTMGAGECDRLAGARCQGIAAEVGYAYADLDDLLARQGLLVFLDSIADPHNLGAILRTAEAAGAIGVVLPERRAAHVTATVMRVSAGAAIYLPVARVTNLVRAMQSAREAGFFLLGLAASASAALPRGSAEDPRLGDRVGLVVGGEGEGMHRLVAENCDELVRLPMRGRVESLNASVAAALAIYRLLDQRLFSSSRGGKSG